ncbi:hypothetical protein DFH09DRAFT_1039693, partial [Mycena vulgaris]
MLRTYAMYGRNNRVLGFMVVVAAGAIGVGVWSVISDNTTSGDNRAKLALYTGCTSPISRSEGRILAGAWAGMATFDSMIFSLTLYQALNQHNLNGRTLLSVLIRDGSVYFGVIVAANLSNILTFLLAEVCPTKIFCVYR